MRSGPPGGHQAAGEDTWIVTDGSVGMEAQGIAVAEAVGLSFGLRRARVTGAMGFLPAPLQLLVPASRLLRFVASNAPLEAPWPRLVISIGRRSVPIALAIKRLSHPHAFALHIQNPKVPARLFDLIAAPVHDNFEGPNVIVTFGAVHSVTESRLAEEAARFAPHVKALPHLVSSSCSVARAKPSAFRPTPLPLSAPSSRRSRGKRGAASS